MILSPKNKNWRLVRSRMPAITSGFHFRNYFFYIWNSSGNFRPETEQQKNDQ